MQESFVRPAGLTPSSVFATPFRPIGRVQYCHFRNVFQEVIEQALVLFSWRYESQAARRSAADRRGVLPPAR